MPDDAFEPAAEAPSTGPRPFDDQPETPPSGLLLAAMLWLSPGRFFEGLGTAHRPLLTTVAIILAGLGAAADRSQSRRVTAELSDSSNAHLPQTWAAEWTLILIAGLFGGFMLYAVGGWWHRLRLRWCGVKNPDPILSRQIFMLSKLVFALPALAVLLYYSVAHPTPDAAYQEGWFVLDLAVLAAVCWASFSNYRGVRVVFGARRGRAIFWFLALPWGFYGAIVGVVAAAFFFAALTPDEARPPLSVTPRPFRSAAWTFNHPVQWTIATEDNNYDPERFVRIFAAPDGWFMVQRYESTITPGEETAVTLDMYSADFGPLRDNGTFTEWGGVVGVGVIATGQWEGESIRFRAFATTLVDGTMLEVTEAWLLKDRASVLPGFEMIRNSFSLLIPVAEAPDEPTAPPLSY